MKPESKFNNGDRVRDTMSDFKGTIIGTTLWLNGCYRYCIQAQQLHDGKPVEASFDENQLELVESKNYKGKHDTGGPWPDAIRR